MLADEEQSVFTDISSAFDLAASLCPLLGGQLFTACNCRTASLQLTHSRSTKSIRDALVEVGSLEGPSAAVGK